MTLNLKNLEDITKTEIEKNIVKAQRQLIRLYQLSSLDEKTAKYLSVELYQKLQIKRQRDIENLEANIDLYNQRLAIIKDCE